MTLDPLILTPLDGWVTDNHWIELPISGPAARNVLVLASGIARLPDDNQLGIDTEGETADTHIWIETGYEFADGDTLGSQDFAVSAQLDSVNLEDDPFTFQIRAVRGWAATPSELASLSVIDGSGGSPVPRQGPADPLPSTAGLVIVITYHQSGDCTLLRVGYQAAVRLKRVDPNRQVGGVVGDR
jgi:hypothetical protein